MTSTQDLIQRYFRSKTKQLLALAQEAICEHPGLRGSHREEILRVYLSEILPRRFTVGNGMVYGVAHRSREADIVIWDAQNYPSLPMRNHNFFFAESVTAILEVKTEWNTNEWLDVLSKCEAISSIYTVTSASIWDDIAMLQMQIDALSHGHEPSGMLRSKHRIGSSAIFYYGGKSLTADSIAQDLLEQADDKWPDTILLLDTGRVIIKQYEQTGTTPFHGKGILEFIEAGEDALAIFSAAFLGLMTDRSTHVDEPLYLAQYLYHLIHNLPRQRVEFPVTRPIPGRQII